MLRLVGALLLMIGTTGVGFSYCQDIRERIRCLGEIKQLFILISDQISYTGEALPEICHILSGRVGSPFSFMLKEVYEHSTKNTGEPFPIIWREICMRHTALLPLSPPEREILASLIENIGFGNKISQKQQLEMRIKRLKESMEALEKKRINQEKIIMSFGIFGGLMVIIILI